LLRDHGIEPQIRDYVGEPPTQKEIKELLTKLKIEPHALLRKKEKAYKAAGLAADATAAQVAKAIAAEPLLLERPVVVKGAKAVIGRPTEAIEALL
jgi:arsenate reductase